MTRRTRIVAVDAGTPDQGAPLPSPETLADDSASADDAWWDEPIPSTHRSWRLIAAITLSTAALGGWTALFVAANWGEMLAGASLPQWTAWLRDWSIPALLVAMLWLLAMRNSRREAQRFGGTARMLSDESARLEERLLTVNRELSLAREFISAQARDIESVGRIASERLTEHANQLSGLVEKNSARIETIDSVGAAALENMERLRGQLPVIANSAKDVTNNIGAAGQAARGQIEELIVGFHKLNQFGQASERQVHSLRDLVDSTIAEFARQSEQMGEIAQSRFAALTEQGEEFRTRLGTQEVEALAAVRARAQALTEELHQTRAILDGHESESLASLRTQLETMRGESSAIIADLRSGEATALENWQDAITRLGEQMANLEQLAAQHREVQHAHASAISEHGEALAERLDGLAGQMGEISDHGAEAGTRLASSLTAMDDKLVASREAVTAADTAIAALTDNSIRLLELIQASVQHSTHDLPAAIDGGHARLAEIEARMGDLSTSVNEAERRGAALSGHIGESTARLSEALAQIEALQSGLADGSIRQAEAITALHHSLEAVRAESMALAEQAQAELGTAIADLSEAAKGAAATVSELSSEAVAATANRLGEESRKAIDKAMRARAAEVSGQLEQAVAHAAGSGREAAIQLRDQLAKVNDLAKSLEQRVAHARARAEEQIDNDFSRRVALITESLNSNAIDIARALDSEVTDTAWANYLKGNRGIFTRRAVKLLETGEARSISQLYESDRDFREHVSRYIHDFEAMLRQLLSTRDGHALGVTLLSSDMGKLYVALAQAIERLRN